jgi:WD40 repeat protein
VTTLDMDRMAWAAETSGYPMNELDLDLDGGLLAGRAATLKAVTRYWNIRTGEQVRQSSEEAVSGWSPERRLRAVCHKDSIQIVDNQGKTLRWVILPWPVPLGWRPNSQEFAFTSNFDGRIRLLRMRRGTIAESVTRCTLLGIPAVAAISPTGAHVAVAVGMGLQIADIPSPPGNAAQSPTILAFHPLPSEYQNRVLLADLSHGSIRPILSPGSSRITAMAFAADGVLVVADEENEVRWIDTGKELVVARWWSLAPVLAMSRRGDKVVLADSGAGSMNLPAVYSVRLMDSKRAVAEGSHGN